MEGAMCPADNAERGKHNYEYAEQVVSAPFCLTTLCTLSLSDLSRLEATCVCIRSALSSELASLVWALPAQLHIRRNRLLLPFHILAKMPLIELKCLLGKIKLARGSLGCGPVPILESTELHALSSVCFQIASTAQSSITRVIAARLHFDVETESIQPSIGSEMSFWWPARNGRGCRLTASLVCGKEFSAIEISSAIIPSKQDARLTIDLHLIAAGWARQFSATSLQVDVNGKFTNFAIPGLDVTDEHTRRALTTPGGAVCILAVRSSFSGTSCLQPLPVPARESISLPASARTLDYVDVLALEMPMRSSKSRKRVPA